MATPGGDLAHYGIKGMKWGVRRSGGTSSGSTSKSKTPRPVSEDHTNAQTLKKKRLSEMSNAELKKLNERMQLEQNYKNLMSKEKSSQIGEGQKKMKQILRTVSAAREVNKVLNDPAGKLVKKALTL